ncbi:hypothetical protein QFZ35_002581 [Arthrobacter ulcerisalmonis]|nr:hypothetical protein [Arthrobacter ulcerisalmonis]
MALFRPLLLHLRQDLGKRRSKHYLGVGSTGIDVAKRREHAPPVRAAHSPASGHVGFLLCPYSHPCVELC